MHDLRKSLVHGEGSGLNSPLVEKKNSRSAKAGSLGSVSIPRAQARSTHQREEDRFSSVVKTVQVDWRDQSGEAAVKNISSKGVQIATKLPAEIGETVALRFADCDPIDCEVRWIREDSIGLEFVAETQVLADAGVVDFIVDNIKASLRAAGEGDGMQVGVEKRHAAERHGLVWLASLRIGNATCTARLRNISTSGAMVHWEGIADPTKGDHVTLDLGPAGKIGGVLKWVSGQETGIAFDEDYDVSRLAKQRATHTGIIRDIEGDSDDLSVDERVGRAMRSYAEPQPFMPPTEKSRLTLEELYETLYPNGRPEEPKETDIAG